MKPRTQKALSSLIVCLSAHVLWLATAPRAEAFSPPKRERLTNYDKREQWGNAEAAGSSEQKAAAAGIEEKTPKVQVHFAKVTGSPAHISAKDSFLTGAQSQLMASDPHGPTREFINANRGLFGHGGEALDKAKIRREFVTGHNGLRTVVWEQQVDGIPVFESVLISHTTANGELVNISSQFMADPEQAA